MQIIYYNVELYKIFDPNNFMILVMGNQDSCATFLNRFDNVEYYKPGEELR